MASDKIDELYDALKADGLVEKDRDNFRSYMLAPGEQGYRNRLELYNALRADELVSSPTYEEFRDRLGLVAAGAGNNRSDGSNWSNRSNSGVAPSGADGTPSGVDALKPGVLTADGVDVSGAGFDARVRAIGDRVRRSVERVTPEGRSKRKVAETTARLLEADTRLPGLIGRPAGAETAGEPAAQGQSSPGDKLPDYGGVGPEVHGVRMGDDGKATVEWLLPDGSVTEDRNVADMAEWGARRERLAHEFQKRMRDNGLDPEKVEDVQRQRVEDKLAQNEERLRKLVAERDAEEHRERDDEGGLMGFLTEMGRNARRSVGANVPKPEHTLTARDKEIKDLLAANDLLDEARRTLVSGGKLKKSEGVLNGIFDFANNAVNVFRGMRDVVSDPDFVGAGVMSMHRMDRLGKIKDKMDKGLELSDSELNLLSATALNGEVVRGADLPHGYRAGATVAEMLPFMAQMMLNPASGVSKAMAKRFGKTTARRIAATVAGDVAESAVLANTLQGQKTVADIRERHMGEVAGSADGGYAFTGGESWAKAIRKGEGAAVIENFTEMLGGHFGSILAKGGKAAAGLAEKMGAGRVVERIGNFATSVKASDWGKAIGNIEKRAEWHGSLGEILEEECGIVLNSLFVGDNRISDLVDAEKQIDIALGVGLFGGVVSAFKTGGYLAGRKRAESKLAGADEHGLKVFSEAQWDNIKGRIEGADDSDLGAAIVGVIQDYCYRKGDEELVLDYAKALMIARGYNLAELSRQSEELGDSGTSEELEGSSNRSDWSNQSNPGAEAEAAGGQSEADVLKPGVPVAVEDFIERAAWRDGDAEVLRPVTLKGDNREVYVVKGNIVLGDDGMIDYRGSDEVIYVYDAGSGKVEQVSKRDIASASESVAAADIRSNWSNQNNREGVPEVDFALNDSFRVAVPGRDGTTQQAAVVDREGDRVTVWTPFALNDSSEKGRTMGGFTTDIAADELEGLLERDETGAPVDYVTAGRADNRSDGSDLNYQSNQIDREEPDNPGNPEGASEEVATMPMRQVTERGETREEPDYLAATPPRSHSYIYNESGLSRQEADEHVEFMAKGAKEAVQRHMKSAPKIGGSIARFVEAKAEWEKQGAELQSVVDYWDAVKAEQRKVLDAELAMRKAQDELARDEAQARFEEEQRIKAEKLAEQERIGTNAVNPKLKEKWDNATKIVGNANAHVLADGSTITGHYVLTEAGAASASHDPKNAFKPTEGFPIDENGQNVNDRDYSRDKDAQRMVETMAGSFDSRALQTPVIVSQDGIVLSGNNRTMSGDVAARRGTDGAYVDHLKQYGSMYGFTPEQIASMEHPRVVYVPDEAMPYNSTTFSRFNAQEMKSQSKPEAAVKLGKVVPDNVFAEIVGDINRYERMSDFYANEGAAARALGALHAAGVVNDAQMPELRTGTALSAAGKELLENTLIGKVFQSEPDAVRKVMEMPSMRQTIVMGLAEIANNKGLAAKGYGLVDELSKAVDLCYRAKASNPEVYVPGVPVSPFGRMAGLFDDEYGDSHVTDATTLLLADLLNDTKPSRLRNVLTVYNKQGGEAASGAMDLFTGEIASKETILTEINNHFINATPKEQQSIVDAAIVERKAAAESMAESTATSAEGPGDGDQGTEQAPNPVQRSEGDRVEPEPIPVDPAAAVTIGCELSEELNEFGKPFVKSSDGTTDFGYVDAESGLAALPIKLSLGENYKDENGDDHGYGYLHIDSGHGREILQNGFSSVEEFVETVARNYTDIKEGAKIGNNQTYLLEVPDEHNNTLFIQLSRDGKYWNVNSAGIFKKKYSRRKPKVYSKPAVGSGKDTDTTEVNSGQSEGATAPAGNSSKTSEGKVNALSGEKQAESEESFDFSPGDKRGEDVKPGASAGHGGKGDASAARKAREIAAAEAAVNTNPTEAQKKAGNYKMGHFEIDGLDITIENPKGSVRRGTDAGGKAWETKMNNTYGYIKGTTGVDGDKIDIFLSDNPTEGNVYVVDQYNTDGTFDEHKVMYGFNSATEAEAAYLSNYSAGWARTRLVIVIGVDKAEFKKWLASSKRKTKPFAEYKAVRVLEEQEGGDVFFRELCGFAKEFKEVAQNEMPKLQKKLTKWIAAQPDSKLVVLSTAVMRAACAEAGLDAGKAWAMRMCIDKAIPAERVKAIWEKRERSSSDAINQETGNNRENRDVAGGRFDRTVPETPDAQRSAISRIIDFAKDVRNKVERAVIGGVTKRQMKDFAENGIDVDETWVHSFESSAVTHNQKHHGNAKAEATRGQIAITADDYARIPDILDSYDKVSKSSNKTKGTENEVIIYEKEFGDGYVYYLEEKRDNRKSLAFHTMYKKKKGADSSDGFAVDTTAPITPLAPPDNLSSLSEGKGSEIAGDMQAGDPNNGEIGNHQDVAGGRFEVSDALPARYDREVYELSKGLVKEAIGADNVIEVDDAVAASMLDAKGAPESGSRFDIRTYHGSGADFDAFDHSHIGEGEGAQVYGWGSYVTEHEGVGKTYADFIGDNVARENADVANANRDWKIASEAASRATSAYFSTEDALWESVADEQRSRDSIGKLRAERDAVREKHGEDSVEYSNWEFNNGDELRLAERQLLSMTERISELKAELKKREQLLNDANDAETKARERYNDVLGEISAVSHHLYTVDIPTDSGTNYLNWQEAVPTENYPKLRRALEAKGVNGTRIGEMLDGDTNGKTLYNDLKILCGSDRAASEFLHSAGFVGIKYMGERLKSSVEEGVPCYVIFNEADLKIKDHVRYLRDSNGRAYGWTVGGKVYLNRDAANAETPVHEYTHLWDEMVKTQNPELWTRGKELLKELPLWDAVKNDPNYADIAGDEDAIASEVHSRLMGEEGAAILDDMVKRARNEGIVEQAKAHSLVQRVKAWLADMFNSLKATLGKWSKQELDELTLDDFNGMTMRDLAEGLNPNAEMDKAAEAVNEPNVDYSSHSEADLPIMAENANFASRYETAEGKTINYSSENPEGYGGLFDFDFSGENRGSDAVNNRAGADGVQREGDSGLYRRGGGLNGDAGEFCVVERVFTESGSFNFTSGERIESAADVAYIFSALEDAAKEHSFVVLVKDGRPTVIELGMGTFTATMVDMPTASLAYNRIRPDEVYFVHNHPSGNLKCSPQDVQMLRKFEDMADVPVMGVIINLKTGKYGTFDVDSNTATGVKRVPDSESILTVHTLDKQIFAPDYDPMAQPLVRGSQDVAEFLNSHRMGDRAKVSFIILSRAGRIVGNIHTPFTEIPANVDDVARYISERVIQFGGESAIVYGDFNTAGDKGFAYRKLKERMMQVGATTLLDVVNVKGNHTISANDEGMLREPGMEYGAEEADNRSNWSNRNNQNNRENPEVADVDNTDRPDMPNEADRPEAEDVEAINSRFNSELKQQINGKLPEGHIYQLGRPGVVLQSTGVPNLPIQMSASRLLAKATEYGHDFQLAEIRNLVKELHTPMAVFSYGNKGKMQNIIVGIESNGKQFIVGLSLNPIVNGKALEINSVRNVFPKNNAEWLNWISQGKLLYADKQKIQALIDKQRTILADVAYLDLDDVAKVVNSFENPAIEGEKSDGFVNEPAAEYGAGGHVETLEEKLLRVQLMVAERHGADVAVRDAAVESLGKTLGNIRRTMQVQHTYDVNTARALEGVARVLMETGTFMPESRTEIKRLMGVIRGSMGRTARSERDFHEAVDSLMDLLVDNQLKLAGRFLDEMLAIKGSKVNARGVEVMGQLDVEGQIMVRSMKDFMGKDAQTIRDRIATLDDIIAGDNEAAAMNAAAEKLGVELARQYVEEVAERASQELLMSNELRDMKEQWNSNMSGDERKAYIEQRRALRESIRKIRIERADALRALASNVGNDLRNSIERVRAFREQEKQRIEDIWHNANSDMAGRAFDEHGMKDNGPAVKLSNNMVARLLMAPAATFEQVMRVFGRKSINGEGYLYDRFVRGWQKCRDIEWKQTQAVEQKMNEKAAEVLGKKGARWSDLYALTKEDAGMCEWWDGGEVREHKVTQGNLMYIYMVNKMTDGQVKLRRMRITEDKMREVESALNPKLRAVADWLQDEFLPKQRNRYNRVHVRMFGAPMAEIDNYFPLKILANARIEEVEMAGKIDGKDLPKTMTGAIIKRRYNNYALDVLGSDAVSVALDHVREMETWAAFAEYRRDLCTLLSYKHFRNQVKNMTTIYGSGEKFWDKFYDLSLLVGGAYQPKTSEFDKVAVNLTKLATSACIAIRLNTALKQLLSYPAFGPEANVARLMYNMTPWRARECWKWAMENMPSFERRWMSRQAGNDLLREWKHDWDWTRTEFVQKIQRAGITPNAFIDALTVSMGAEAVYHRKLKEYIKDGFGQEDAHRKAIEDAEITFNLSQQSSEVPYLSLLQNDRSYLTTCITNFRNSPMSYLRQSIQSKRELINMMKSKDMLMEFETKKGVREGLSEEQARARAERKYRRNWARNVFKSATYDFILPALWYFGLTGAWYCIFGDDDEKKKELAADALKRGTLGGFEGLTFGGTLPDFAYGLITGSKPQLDEESSPAMGLVSDMLNLYSNGKTERAANEMINTMVALGVGVNPQVIEDAVVAGMDFFGQDENNARDWALLAMRVLSCPQSQMDQIYFDELGMTAGEAASKSPAELAERYATYKARRANFATMWAYDDDRWEDEVKKPWRKKFEAEAKARLGKLSEAAVNEKLEAYDAELGETRRKVRELDGPFEDMAAKAAALFDTPEGRRYQIYNDMKPYLDKMIKSWLNAESAEAAATEAAAIVEYKARVVEMLDAWDDADRCSDAGQRAMDIVREWHERESGE